MSLSTQLQALATRIGAEFKAVRAEMAAGSGFWSVVSKTADQSITNSAVETDDLLLKFPVVAGGVYAFEIRVAYTAANATADFKFRLRVTAGTLLGWWRYIGSDTSANALQAETALRLASVANTTTILAGTNAAVGDISSVLIDGIVRCSLAGTVVFQWAQGAANASPTIVKSLSTLCYRRIA